MNGPVVALNRSEEKIEWFLLTTLAPHVQTSEIGSDRRQKTEDVFTY